MPPAAVRDGPRGDAVSPSNTERTIPHSEEITARRLARDGRSERMSTLGASPGRATGRAARPFGRRTLCSGMAPRLLPLALLVAVVPAAAQVAPLAPRDDGAEDPSFITFRGRLIEALAARDTAAVLGAFAPDATVSFGAEPPGPEGVRAVWLSGPRYDGLTLWQTLARVVGMGSVWGPEGVVTGPYTYDGPPGDLDAFTHGAIVGENVTVRAAPSPSAEAIARLTYVVVPVVEWGYSEDPGARLWHRVRLADGREGYVAGEYLWSPLGFRAGFEKRDGRWQIVFFVAGD